MFGCLLFCLLVFKAISKLDVSSLIQRRQKDWRAIEEPSKYCVSMDRHVLLLTGFRAVMAAQYLFDSHPKANHLAS